MRIKYLISKLNENSIKHNIVRVFDRVFATAVLYCYESSNFNLDDLNLPIDYSFSYIKDLPSDLLEDFCKDYRHQGYYENVILPRLKIDSIIGISAMYKGKEIAMLAWLITDLPKVKYLFKYPYNSDTFYPMDGFVSPKHRGQGLHKYSINKRFQIAYELGKKKGYGIVYSFNIPALKDNDKYGTRIGKVLIFKIPFRYSVNLYNVNRIGLYFMKKRSIK